MNTPPPTPAPRWVLPSVLAVSRLRTASAWAVLPAASWLLLAVEGTLAKAVGLMGSFAAVGWLAAARRLRREPPPCLYLGHDGLYLSRHRPDDPSPPPTPPEPPPTLHWSDLEAIEVDEEALCLRLHRRDAPPLVLRPPWNGVGLHELAMWIRAFRSEHASAEQAEPDAPVPQEP